MSNIEQQLSNNKQLIIIGDNPLTLTDFNNIVCHKYKIKLSLDAEKRINEARKVIEDKIEKNEIVYGVNTGFGSLKDVIIDKKDLCTLQYNLIRSHAVGIGDPIPEQQVRGMMLLRITCFCNGNSGIKLENVQKIVDALNANFLMKVPCQGTVGASGDLAQLSHMTLGLLGEGLALDPGSNEFIDAAIVLKKLKLTPLVLGAKEGLALNNGVQYITTILALACIKAQNIMRVCNLAAAFSVEALHGTTKAFHPLIHQARPHQGQIDVASSLIEYINSSESEIQKKYTQNKVQDAYSLRCIPQVHGPAYHYIRDICKTVEIEMNSSNDNPLIFPNENLILSGGNFHGMPIAMAADVLSLAMATLCNISERRTDRLINSYSNGFMPSFLTDNPGINSGLMICQYVAASLASENRHLALNNCQNSIPTCEGVEDHVSMGGWSSRKALMAVDNTYKVISYELYTACQAFKYTKEKPSSKLSELFEFLNVKPVNNDTYMQTDIERIYSLIDKIAEKICLPF